MRVVKKRYYALSLALAISVGWQGMPAFAEETSLEQMTEKEKMDLEISSKMINNYCDIEDEQPPMSVLEYEDYIPQNYAMRTDDKYDPRTDEEISSAIPTVRSQSPFGTCWAHSAMAMVEMSLLKQRKLPVDENMSEFQTVFL